MTNNASSEGNNAGQADALAALHGMQSTPPPESEPEAPDPAAGASPSSTGLVGMLAQGQLSAASPDLGGSSAGLASGMPMGVPQPKSAGSKGPGPKRPGKFDTIGMAKEIKMPESGQEILGYQGPPTPSPARRGRRIAKPPEWWKAVIPVFYTISSLLMLIGIWAIGGLIFVLFAKSGWPGVNIDPDALLSDRFSANWMVLVMLMCLPVSITLGIMATMLSRKIKIYEHKMAAQSDAA